VFVVKVNQQLITTEENSRSLPFKKNIQNMLSGGFTTNNSWIVKILKPMKKSQKKIPILSFKGHGT